MAQGRLVCALNPAPEPMTAFIHALNHLGANFAYFALSMLVQSSLLIAALFLLDLLLRKKVRAVVRYPLCMLLLLKLVLPPSLAVPTGLAYWLPERKVVTPLPVTPLPVAVHYSETGIVEPPVLQRLPPSRPRLEVAGKLLLAWLAIALALMAWLVRRSHSVARTAARATPASSSPEELLKECRQQMRIKQRVNVRISVNAGSPAVCGLWRPVILLPQALADKLSPLQMRAVLFHELAHIQRGDIWVNYAQTLLQIFYWWHPLLWLANAHIRRVREQAVDERVMVEMGREAEAYPNTLLEVAKLASRGPMPALGFIGIVESKSALGKRIRHLLDSPAPKSAKLGFARLAAIALVGAALLPMARGQRKQGAQAPAPTPQSLSQSAAIEVEARFVSLTDATLENLLRFRPKTIAASGHFVWTLSPAELNELLQRMERQPGAVILSAPRVTTTNTRQAQIAVDGIQPFLHPKARTSAAFQIIPYEIGGSLDLTVSAKITESGDVGSVFGSDLSRNPKEDTNDASPGAKSNQVYAVNAVGYINYDVGTAQTLVGDGGAVILHNPALTGADGRKILVVVSPRIVRQSASVMEQNPNAISAAASPNASTPLREAMDARRIPPTNSLKSQPTKTLTRSEGQGATKRFASSTGQEVEIEAIKPGAIQYDPGTGICVVTNDFVLRFNGSVLTARRVQVNSKTGEVIAEGAVTLQRGDQVLRAERLQYDYIHQKITDGVPSNSVPVLGDLPLLGRLFRSEATPGSQGRKAIQAKLNRIVLPEIGFDNVRLPEAIQRLAKESSDRDPDGTGLNFLLNPNLIGAPQEAMIDPNTGQALSPPAPLDFNTVMVRINPPLRNVRLSEAIEALVHTADKPIRYSIEDYAVIFWQKLPGTKPLETRIFRFDPETFYEDPHRFLLQAGWSDIEIFGHSNEWKASIIRKFGESLGLSHVPPNTFFYSEGMGWLRVRATPEELDRVQKAIETLNALRQSASRSPAAPANVGEDKVSQANAAEELLVAITAQYIYLGPQPVTLEMLKTKLAEAKGRNPNLRLVVKADRNAPVEQLAGVLETARSLNIEPKSAETIELGTRVFRVNPATLLEGLKNASGVTAGSGTIADRRRINNSIQDSIREFFTAAGVNVQPPNALFYNDRTGVLMVRATAKEMDLVEKVLETLNYRAPQITIEAKFMELPTEVLGQLGLDVPPPARTSKTWARILTAAQTRAVFHAAEQRAGVDILSAPKITTLSGRQAQIQAVQTRTVVTGIDPKALAPPGVRSTNRNPAQPYLTSQVLSGPTLDVVATVGGDGYTIHLAALPQVTEFLRYETTLNAASETRVWVDGKQRNVPRPLPVIRTRQMQATLDVYDGQTLVLGSPRVTQVLQQSNGQSVTNAIPEDLGKRLLVFITPTIIDPAGNPIHTSGNEPWADKTPPPPR